MPTIGAPELLIVSVMVAMFVVVPLVLIMLLVRAARRDPTDVDGRDPAMVTLRSRFASGAIDEIEFERLRHILLRR